MNTFPYAYSTTIIRSVPPVEEHASWTPESLDQPGATGAFRHHAFSYCHTNSDDPLTIEYVHDFPPMGHGSDADPNIDFPLLTDATMSQFADLFQFDTWNFGGANEHRAFTLHADTESNTVSSWMITICGVQVC